MREYTSVACSVDCDVSVISWRAPNAQNLPCDFSGKLYTQWQIQELIEKGGGGGSGGMLPRTFGVFLCSETVSGAI